MLHIKFRENRPAGSGEDFLKGFYHIRGLSQKFVDNMDNFVQTRGKSILRLLLFCQLY